MRPRNRIVIPDSDEESDDGSTHSDNTVKNSKLPKQKRKVGRPPGTTKKKSQSTQDDSDNGGSTRPNTPENASDDESTEDDNSNSNYMANSASTSKRRTGRPSPAANKKQRLQNGTIRDTSPQPSTSYQAQNGINENAEESENESDSSSADSDFGCVNERTDKKKPAVKKMPQRTDRKKTSSYANSNASRSTSNNSQFNGPPAKNSNRSTSNSSQVNGSHAKGAKLLQKEDPSSDLNLVESLAQKLVYYLLIEDQKKYAIRRKGIVRHVLEDDYTPKLYNIVVQKANVILKKLYGMELMELENQKDSYLIVNILRRELSIHDYVDIPRIKQQQHGLILFLLTVIFMNENVISEDELSKSLKPLGIDLTSKIPHPVFGDVKKYITTELVKQMYLNYECISKDPPRHEFSWGLRAKQEFDKSDLLQFVCTIVDDTAPEDWRIQYRDAEASAKPNTGS